MRAGAQMVKIEGGEWLAETVRFLVERSIPVCGHVGLTPQSVHAFGGFKVQGKSEAAARADEARRPCAAGSGRATDRDRSRADPLASEVTPRCAIPTIGIGAGIGCSGQVLVLHDMLGIFHGKRPRFVKDFMQGQPSIFAAVEAYVRAVKDGSFPGRAHVLIVCTASPGFWFRRARSAFCRTYGELLAHTLAGNHQKKSENNHVACSSR